MRLIDADVFELNMQNEWEQNEISNGDWIHFREMIKDEPTIEAVPERKGRWNRISPAKIYECSVCGRQVMTDDIDVYAFCHGCGAKMEGAEECV